MSPAPRHHPEGSVWIHTMMVVGAEKEKRIWKFLCIFRFKELMSALHTGKNSWPV